MPPYRLALYLMVAPLVACASDSTGSFDSGAEDLALPQDAGAEDVGRDAGDNGDAAVDMSPLPDPDAGAADVAPPQHGDCRDEGADCLAPFTCIENVTNIFACHSAPDDWPTCAKYTPLDVPIRGGIGYAIAHWLAGSCLDVTYEAALAPQSAAMGAAIDAWNGIACNSLCLKAPVENNTKIPRWMAARRIHVTTGAANEAWPNYEYTTGRMLKAAITVSMAKELTTAEWIRLFGGVMGLDGPDPGVDSIMVPQGDAPTITLPTANDTAAICLLYGTPPICGE